MIVRKKGVSLSTRASTADELWGRFHGPSSSLSLLLPRRAIPVRGGSFYHPPFYCARPRSVSHTNPLTGTNFGAYDSAGRPHTVARAHVQSPVELPPVDARSSARYGRGRATIDTGRYSTNFSFYVFRYNLKEGIPTEVSFEGPRPSHHERRCIERQNKVHSEDTSSGRASGYLS